MSEDACGDCNETAGVSSTAHVGANCTGDENGAVAEKLKPTSKRNSRSVDSLESVSLADLTTQELIGRGAYGAVYRAVWKGKIVAVKIIENENEMRSFKRELHLLASTDHPNIIQLYGAGLHKPVCIVMELAECGSLQSLLHPSITATQRFRYNTAHAIDWLLQCARGTAYLHSLDIVHRDLKPHNLLLRDRHRLLKLCDFGTACDLQTQMTENRGSPAWMAPEVFRGKKYTEKCDVYSIGIITWQLLVRRQPFQEMGNNAFSVIWGVHQGARPPLIWDCPRALEILITRCWQDDQEQRPTAAEVEKILTYMAQFFDGLDDPIVQEIIQIQRRQTSDPSDDSFSSCNNDEEIGTIVPEPVQTSPHPVPKVIPDVPLPRSQEPPLPHISTLPVPPISHTRHASDDVREPSSTSARTPQRPPGAGHRRGGSYDTNKIKTDVKDVQSDPQSPSGVEIPPVFVESLHPSLWPIPPADNDESLTLFRDHCNIGREFLQCQAEINLLHSTKTNLVQQLVSMNSDEERLSCLDGETLLTTPPVYSAQRSIEQLQTEKDGLSELIAQKRRELEALHRLKR